MTKRKSPAFAICMLCMVMLYCCTVALPMQPAPESRPREVAKAVKALPVSAVFSLSNGLDNQFDVALLEQQYAIIAPATSWVTVPEATDRVSELLAPDLPSVRGPPYC